VTPEDMRATGLSSCMSMAIWVLLRPYKEDGKLLKFSVTVQNRGGGIGGYQRMLSSLSTAGAGARGRTEL